jgi:hypothetical protein
MLLLVPISAALLIPSLVFLDTSSPAAILSYLVSAYTLTVWCMRIPDIIKALKTFKRENKFARRWFSDERLRLNVSLYGALLFNTAYAALQLWLGIAHSTFWFYSLAGYYVLLAAMRFFIARYLRRNTAGEKQNEELVRFRILGWLFLIINLALSVMVFFMIYWNRTFVHDEITTIAMAAYTFASLALAIINTVKYRKYNSPIYTATKSISLAAASVSILTLEATMLQTFGGETVDDLTRKLFLGLTGGAVAAFIIVMSVYMIYISTKKLALLKDEAISKTKED